MYEGIQTEIIYFLDLDLDLDFLVFLEAERLLERLWDFFIILVKIASIF